MFAARTNSQRPAILLALVVVVLLNPPGAVASGIVNVSLLTTSETLLSGTLASCDPSPNVSTCIGGMASVCLRGRQLASTTNGTVLLLPWADSLSDLSRMHPYQVGINLLMYVRIRDLFTNNNTGVNVLGYMATPASIAGGGSSFSILLTAQMFKPLSTAMAIPYDSIWRFVVQSTLVYDLATMSVLEMETAIGGTTVATTPRMAFVQTDQSEGKWTTSTRVNPLQYGTRLNASAYTYSASENLSDNANTISLERVTASLIAVLRGRIGLIVHINNDNSIPFMTLLQDMLAVEIENEYVASQDAVFNGEAADPTMSHLPDVLLQIKSSTKVAPYFVTVQATYVTDNGQQISKSRQVLIAQIVTSSTASLNLQVNVSAVLAAINTVGGTVPASSVVRASSVTAFNTTVENAEKDSLYYSDQAVLLTYSRAALANDRVIGNLSTVMPALQAGPTVYTCYAGECAEGSLIARAINWRVAGNVGMISSSTPSATSGYPAGNITLADAYSIYPFPDLLCKAVITGLRLWGLIQTTVGRSKFTTSYYSKGWTLLQLAGVNVEYAIQANGLGKVVSISIYNATTGVYEPIERLRYYTIGATNYQCVQQLVVRDFFSANSLYRGESVVPVYTQQPVQEVIASYLASHSPYSSNLSNYYKRVPLSDITSGARSYLEYSQGLQSCLSTQYYDAGVDTCFDCENGFERSSSNVSSCTKIQVSPSKTPLIAGLAAAGAVLLLAAVAGVILLEYKRRSSSRSNRNAPRGTSNVAVIFTDIKSSTKMWGAAPISMGISLDDHHQLIRSAIANHRGYEVKTVGDSFMIVVDDAQRAVDLAVEIQRKLYTHTWPSAIDDAYDSNFDTDINDDPEDVYGPEEGAPWNGLRVRIGIHYGPVEVVFDEVTKGYDYYGPTVNVAARVEGVGDGGQLCVSGAVVSAIQPTTDTYQTILLAKTNLRGVRDEMEVYEIKPSGIPSRVFNNPLIFDEEAKAAMMIGGPRDESLTTLNTRDTNASHSSSYKPLNSRTRPIRDAVREALRALRGAERVHILEKLRLAWRIELPSGKPFKGLTAEQMVAKQQRKVHKPTRRTRPASQGKSRSYSSTNQILSGSRTLSQSLGTDGKASVIDIELDSVHSHTEEGDEDDEDLIFRVMAQRCAPSLGIKGEAKAEHRVPRLSVQSGTHAESISTMSDYSSAASGLRSSGDRMTGSDPHTVSQHSSTPRNKSTAGAAAFSASSVTNITHLIDLQSFRGSSNGGGKHNESETSEV